MTYDITSSFRIQALYVWKIGNWDFLPLMFKVFFTKQQ